MPETALSVDEAMDLDIADAGTAGDLEPYQPPFSEPETYDEGQLEEDGAHSLSLDDATSMLADDETDSGSASKQPPVASIDGRELTLSELIQSYKGQERIYSAAERLAEQWIDVEDAAERLTASAWALAGFVQQIMQPAPDARLAGLDPTAYVQQQAAHERGVAMLNQVLSHGQLARHSSVDMQGRQQMAVREDEMRKLVAAFPECATPEGRAAFLDRVSGAAYACDFSEPEILAAVDHRLFRLAYLAAIGQQALQQNRQIGKGRKARKAAARRISEAAERLKRSGSLADAMAVDFA